MKRIWAYLQIRSNTLQIRSYTLHIRLKYTTYTRISRYVPIRLIYDTYTAHIRLGYTWDTRISGCTQIRLKYGTNTRQIRIIYIIATPYIPPSAKYSCEYAIDTRQIRSEYVPHRCISPLLLAFSPKSKQVHDRPTVLAFTKLGNKCRLHVGDIRKHPLHPLRARVLPN